MFWHADELNCILVFFVSALDSFRLLNTEKNNLNIIEGNTAVIPCELPKGNPRPISLFTFDNNRIEIEPHSSRNQIIVETNKFHFVCFCLPIDRYKILPSGNLHIFNVRETDSGIYQCSAKNPLTGDIVNNTRLTILQVSKRPLTHRERQPLATVYKPPVASKVLVGDNYSIECVITGWPKPSIEWEKYGDILPDKRSEVIHGTLFLYNIRLEDRGTYICRASNTNGQSDIAYTALVEVLGKKM